MLPRLRPAAVPAMFSAAVAAPCFLLLLAACGSSPPPPVEDPGTKKETKTPERQKLPEMKADIGALDERAVTKAFDKLMPSVEACQDRRRKENDKLDFLAGEVGLEIRVAEDGHARAVFLTRSTIGDRTAEKCIVEAAKKADWPKPIGGREGIAKNGFTLPMKGERDAVQWAESKVDAKARATLRGCKAGKNIVITAYVDATGHVIAAGTSMPTDGLDAVAECLVDATSKLKLPSPGGFPAKVTFSVD